MRRRTRLLLLVLASLLGSPSFGRAEIIERVIAKVNGDIITLSEFQERQIAAAQAARITPDKIGSFLRQNNARLLQDAIDEILLLQKAESSGLALPATFADDVIESIKEENNITSEEQFQAALDREGLTLDELRENIRKSYTRQMIIRRDVEPRLSVTEAQLRDAYDKRKDTDFTQPATVTLQEILVSDDAGGIDLARQLVDRARGGEDFASLARTYSAAPSAASGGDLGEIAQGNLNPDLERIAFELPVGAVSDPITSEAGHRILKIVAKKDGHVVPYAAAKDNLRNRLMAERFEEAYDAYIAEIRAAADVELRVREVPLQLSGPIPEDTLLEGTDPFSLGPSAPALPEAGVATPGAPPPATATDATPVGSSRDDEPATAGPVVPADDIDDEVSTTPQARPERVSPPRADTTEATSPPE
jgi:parvulin-like peptidyl-prolyl isomerase